MPERIECIDDRSLLIADHPHFLEICERVQPELGGPLGVRELPRLVSPLDLFLIRHAAGPYICDPARSLLLRRRAVEVNRAAVERAFRARC
jgi:hypothetical protein